MAERKDHAVDAGKLINKNRRILDDLLLTEPLKSQLIVKGVFEKNTIEELFMVSCVYILQLEQSAIIHSRTVKHRHFQTAP